MYIPMIYLYNISSHFRRVFWNCSKRRELIASFLVCAYSVVKFSWETERYCSSTCWMITTLMLGNLTILVSFLPSLLDIFAVLLVYMHHLLGHYLLIVSFSSGGKFPPTECGPGRLLPLSIIVI